MKYLVVDDSPTMRKIVTLALAGASCSFAEAENGRQALDAIGQGSFDCVILDINMPVMGGLEFLQEKAKLPSAAGVPVIVLTTQDEAELKDKAMSLGAKAFVVKPFKKESLLATIDALKIG